MVVGSRSGMPLLAGVMVGACISIVFFAPLDDLSTLPTSCPVEPQKQVIDASEHWQVHLDPMPTLKSTQDPAPKVVRARFAATELGIRERVMVGVLAESPLAVALNASMSRHVPRVHLFADAARIDNDMAQLANLSPYRANGQKSHSFVLALFNNMSLHESYDWVLLVKDSTYINPFAFLDFINSVSWNENALIGEANEEGRCQIDAGIIISNYALRALISNRHLCSDLSDSSDSDHVSFEKCLHLATNLTCSNDYQGKRYSVWRAAGGAAAHDSVREWAQDTKFNRTIAVTKLLSAADATALHDHFVRVEMNRLDAEIGFMEDQLAEVAKDADETPTWPAAIPPYSKPPNRYQVSTWEFFTTKDIFRNEPNQNVRPLEGKDKDDVQEVVNAARQRTESEEPELEFVHFRSGYRMFDPQRGMDYMIDLVYLNPNTQQNTERRVHVSRMIASTQLMNDVPYVKEDTDVTIVVPVNDETEVLPARRLLARHARLCTVPAEESRKTLLVVAVSPAVDPRSVTNIGNDLEELKRRCKRSALETDVLTVKRSAATVDGSSPATAAMDEAIDRFGQTSIFLLLSPYADIQKEFLDRARINTIKHYQVFFPVPFVEYHPTMSSMDVNENEVPADPKQARDEALARLRDSNPPKRKRLLVVEKGHGRFDSLDFSCMSVYGSDYVAMRKRLIGKRIDLISSFLGQEDLHVLRGIEPTLRIRYHTRTCDSDLVEDDLSRCVASKRENVAAKDQLARLLFHEE